ncbi:MAG TPA: type II secretion system protein GspM [Candidatus Limnocylindria bacterium]|nr:type II secretion system protein GspM [Candidatus Limnocylindria bacterium]
MSWRERLRQAWAPVARWYAGYSRRDQRIILGVAVVALLSFLYVGPIEMIRDYHRDIVEETADTQAQVERALKTLRSLDGLRRERDELKQRLKVARAKLLPGGSGTLGAATLEERATELARSKGVEVRTKQVMREEEVGPFRRVAVRFTLAGDIGAIAAMLAGLEYENHFTIPFMELSRRGALVAANAPRTLTATIEVAGYVAGDGGGGEADAADDSFVGPPWPPAEEQPDEAAPGAGATEPPPADVPAAVEGA